MQYCQHCGAGPFKRLSTHITQIHADIEFRMACEKGNRTGTIAGYKAHMKAGEDVCDPCRQAYRDHNRSYSRERIAESKAKGQCIVCDEPLDGARYCKTHSDHYRKRLNRRRKESVDRGECCQDGCSEPLATKWRCEAHAKAKAEGAKRRYHDSQDQGLCTTGGCDEPLRTERLCKDHHKLAMDGEVARREQKARNELLRMIGEIE